MQLLITGPLKASIEGMEVTTTHKETALPYATNRSTRKGDKGGIKP